MDITVVIPTYNRRDLLELSLPALAEQTATDFTYEVVFVVNGSTDGSEAVLQEASERWPDRIRYFVIPPSGTPSAPRNRGIREAKGSVILIVDDDVVPSHDLVQSHVHFHRDHPGAHHAALGQLEVPDEAMAHPGSLFHDMFSFEQFHGQERLDFQDFWTCNVSVKRDFMMEHGMFDEAISYYEDVDCGYRLWCAGMHLHFLPEATGQHLHQFHVEGIPDKGRMIGRGLWEFEQRVTPDQARRLRARHGVLSVDLPPAILIRRVVNRIGFAIVGNPLSLGVLRTLATRSRRRSRVTDLYYYVLFRAHMKAGYRDAKREGRIRTEPLAA